MIWYLLNIFIIVLAWFWPIDGLQTVEGSFDENFVQYKRNKRVCTMATINWIILSGCRDWSVGNDTVQYKVGHFDVTMQTDWTTIFQNFVNKYFYSDTVKDPGYALLEKIFQLFCTNYQLWLVSIAILFFVLLGRKVLCYSSNAMLSYIVFSTLFYGFFAITGLRQTIATALVVFVGIELIKEKKLIWFIVICLIATTIHASAICFLPFYWISKIKINRITLGGYWIAIIASFVQRYRLMAILQQIVGYEQYSDNEGASAGTFMFLLLAMTLFTTIFYKQLLINEDGEEDSMMRISINALFVASFFSSLLLINQNCMRVVQYFSIFIMFLLPKFEVAFKEGVNRKTFNYVCVVLMIFLMVRRLPIYRFFW